MASGGGLDLVFIVTVSPDKEPFTQVLFLKSCFGVRTAFAHYRLRQTA